LDGQVECFCGCIDALPEIASNIECNNTTEASSPDPGGWCRLGGDGEGGGISGWV